MFMKFRANLFNDNLEQTLITFFKHSNFFKFVEGYTTEQLIHDKDMAIMDVGAIRTFINAVRMPNKEIFLTYYSVYLGSDGASVSRYDIPFKRIDPYEYPELYWTITKCFKEHIEGKKEGVYGKSDAVQPETATLKYV